MTEALLQCEARDGDVVYISPQAVVAVTDEVLVDGQKYRNVLLLGGHVVMVRDSPKNMKYLCRWMG